MAIEIKGKISAYPNADGIQLQFMEYPEKSDEGMDGDWYGNYKNVLFDIYRKFGNKPVLITVEKIDKE